MSVHDYAAVFLELLRILMGRANTEIPKVGHEAKACENPWDMRFHIKHFLPCQYSKDKDGSSNIHRTILEFNF